MGTESGGDVCFTPDTAGVYSIIYTVTDACGLSDVCTTLVTVDFSTGPTVSDASLTVALCDTATICVPVPGTSGGAGTVTVTVDGQPAGADICAYFGGSGSQQFEVIATDSCGKADTATVTINATVNGAPLITGIDNGAQFVCALGDTVCLPFSVVDPDNGLSGTSQLGWVNMSDSTVCFEVNAAGQLCDQLIISDSCGLTDTLNYCVDISLNSAPSCSAPADFALEVCDLSEICLAGFSCADPDGNLISSTVNVGTLSNDTVCFTPVAGANQIILTCEDACGATSSCTTTVTVTLNRPPDVSCPADAQFTVCGAGEQICVPGFSSSDPDNNLTGSSVSFGTLNAGQVCFNTDTAGVYTIIYSATDDCGVVAACTTLVAIDFYGPPQFSGSSTTNAGLVCSGGQVCVPIPTVTGGNPPFNYSCSGNGTIVGNQVCFNLNSGNNNLSCQLIVTDDCGNADTTTVNYNASVNRPPTINCQASATYDVCNLDGVICVGGITVNDPDNNIDTVYSNIGTYNMGSVCFTPGAEGVFLITVTVIDECGLQTTCNTSVTVNRASPVECGACPTITIEKAHNVLQGHHVCLSVTSEGSMNELGAFDFLIAYDPSALSALNAEPGTFIEGCDWEYFTYRFGPFGNCNNACPSGLIRIVGLAETNDGASSHPICFGPGTNDPVELARICFQVTNDRTLECQFAPVRFFWIDCGDNVLSDKTGDSLFVSNEIYDYGNPNSIADPTTGFPTFTGIQGYCLDGSGFPGKPVPENCVNFYNGGVDIICADSIDARGDVNLNGQENEIADAVMFTAYFIKGLAAFGTHVEGSIAATEVNGDGIPLTVADLVYLIRVIVGDAAPLNKLNHNSLRVDVSETQNVYSVSDELGGALFVFEGDVAVALLQPQMSLSVGYREGRTYALVNPKFERASEFSTIYAGELLQADGKLVRVEASDIDGATALVYT
ncbi:MAG TPA: hypothetical protein VLB27_07220, partial [candidate division Zixibacteria bacterium]|nr:hypothetical protein [candidate division Zixibacteria bacterium]